MLPVSQFIKDNVCVFKFSFSGFLIKDPTTQRVLAKGTKIDKLYALDEGAKHALTMYKVGKVEDFIWHQWLGHPYTRILETMVSKNIIKGSS